MDNEERALVDMNHQKEVESLKNEVARLAALLEQSMQNRAIPDPAPRFERGQPFTAQGPLATPSVPTSQTISSTQFLYVPTRGVADDRNQIGPGDVPEEFYQRASGPSFVLPSTAQAPLPTTMGPVFDEVAQGKMASPHDMEKFDIIEERLRAIEGADLYDPLLKVEKGLMPRIVIPKKFKVPEFIRYTGNQCPRTHLRLYLSKMAEVARDERLLIHFFSESFDGAALTWFLDLDQTKMRKWRELVDAFMKQYKFNIEMTPDRSSLQSMEKGQKESVREYAQRWREVASKIRPPLLEKELVTLFMNTFKAPYYDYLLSNGSEHFVGIVAAADRIEQAIKAGKIADTTETGAKRGNFGRKKDVDVHHISGSTYNPGNWRNNSWRPRGQWNSQNDYAPMTQPVLIPMNTSPVNMIGQASPVPVYPQY